MRTMVMIPDGLLAEIVALDQTCGACPSQWEGRMADGRPFYVRYRHGYLSVDVYPINGAVDDALNQPDFEFGMRLTNEDAGRIELDDMLQVTGLRLATPTSV